MMKSKKRHLSNAIMCVGGIFIIASAVLAVYNICDESKAAKSVECVLEELIPEIPNYSPEAVLQKKREFGTEISIEEDENIPLYVLNPEVQMSTVTVNTVEYIGILDIPSIDVTLPVTGDWNYDDLRTAPCCYSGSAYSGNFVICAHNYAEHFGSIQNLAEGDELFFTDVEGNTFYYSVNYIDILQPTDVDNMISENCDLTLFTCNFTGQNRITVRCSKITS